VKLLPLQDLDIVLFQVETSGQHLRNLALAVETLRAPAKFDDAAVFLIIGGAVFLRDEVRVVLDAHGPKLKDISPV